MEVPARKGHAPTVVDRDEAPSKFRQDKLQQLRPAFSDGAEEGTITAGNASPITDGAAALVLTSASTAQQRGLKADAPPPLAVPSPALAGQSSTGLRHMLHPSHVKKGKIGYM